MLALDDFDDWDRRREVSWSPSWDCGMAHSRPVQQLCWGEFCRQQRRCDGGRGMVESGDLGVTVDTGKIQMPYWCSDPARAPSRRTL